MRKKGLIILLVVVFLIPLSAQLKKSSPAKAAQSLVTGLVFEKKLAGSKTIAVYVLGDKKIEKQLSQYLDQKVGSATLKTVTGGKGLPSSVPDVLFVSDKGMLEKAKSYCRKNQILSVTNFPSLVKKGITLGIGIKGGQVQLMLNPESTKAEGREWKSAIMKIAKVQN